MAKKNKGPSSSFVKVKCKKCKNEQIVFNKPTTEVKCLVCTETIATASGGKCKIDAEITEILN